MMDNPFLVIENPTMDEMEEFHRQLGECNDLDEVIKVVGEFS